MKAVTFSSIKWPWLRDRDPHLIIVRASIGRFGDEQVLQRPDSELKALAMTELAGTCHAGELPVDTRVTRWGEYPGFKASNPVVSPDGTMMAFQSARSRDAAGVGYGIFVLTLK